MKSLVDADDGVGCIAWQRQKMDITGSSRGGQKINMVDWSLVTAEVF
jgi:hypothetical protein